ncbi:MAG TPA: hypothetical protein VLT86_16530 [Vicinamibacterales bacterium]|nr:hypothetical protein [Vicinamibacterales bacterium]
MNEGFSIRLRRGGKLWPVDDLTPADGLMFDNEKDAFPRSLTLEFDGDNAVTTYRMNRVRELRGWNAGVFNIKLEEHDGLLFASGVDKDAFPPGYYWLRLSIDDVVVPKKQFHFHVEEDTDDTVINVDVQPDARDIELTVPVDEFDDQIKRLITAPASELDDLTIPEWLADGDPRPNRKACLLNLMAKLRTAPAPGDPLIALVDSIFFCGTERAYARVHPELFERLQDLSDDDDRPFYAEGPPTSSMHQKLLAAIEDRGWGHRSDYSLWSFRQEGNPSMQMVIATPNVAGPPFCADIDIDLGNPLQDLQGFAIHMGELIGGEATDHLDLHDKLAKGATKKFLYYDVED